jgi:rod shape-determining protein MreC
MDYVAGSADVKVGDIVVTSGIDGIYPKGFVIGQIESVSRGVGEYGAIVIRPAVDFSALETVLVVLTPPTVPADAGAVQGPNQDRE